KMTVCSLTPSRMGIITLRRVWSKLSVTGLNLAGVSLGKSGDVAGGLGLSWALAGGVDGIAKTETGNGTARGEGFMICPRDLSCFAAMIWRGPRRNLPARKREPLAERCGGTRRHTC